MLVKSHSQLARRVAGELAALVAAETGIIDRIEPWLALVGLRLFHELNEGSQR